MTTFSYQLYCSRNFPPLADTLRMVAAAGYRNVEGYGALYADAAKVAELKQHLAASGLEMPTGHFGIDQLEKEPARVLEIAEALGIGTIYCPFLPPDQRPDTGKGWHAFGQRLQKAGAPFRDAGLGFGWHNHDFEFRKTADGTLPLTAIFEGGPDLEWEADIAWVIRGGADPLEWIRTMGQRITAVHVKDIAPAGENRDEDGWADVGQGTVDWRTLMAALKEKSRAKYYVVEHDNPKDDKRFAERSLAAAEKL
jgi:sugar phosphate isomerase/epimerase